MVSVLDVSEAGPPDETTSDCPVPGSGSGVTHPTLQHPEVLFWDFLLILWVPPLLGAGRVGRGRC